MTDVSPRAILDRTALFRGLDESWRQKLAELSYIAQFSTGQVIFLERDEVPGLYCVGSGLVRVVKDGPKGRQLVLHLAQPGQTFGEVAVFGNFSAPATAEALEETLCCVLPCRSLRALLETHHELCLGLLSATAYWVRTLVTRLEEMVLYDAASRLARYLLKMDRAARQSSFSLPVSKKDLAAHLNLTQETLSRTLRKLMDLHLIDSRADGTVRVLDALELTRLAEMEEPSAGQS